MNIIDTAQLEKLARRWSLTSKETEKVGKDFMRKMGDKLKQKTKAQIRASGVKRKTGAYRRSIKRGKVYRKKDDYRTRVYSNQPHAHLIEEGHRQVMNPPRKMKNGEKPYKYLGKKNSRIRGRNWGLLVEPGEGKGKTIGKIRGRYVMRKAGESFEPVFEREANRAVEDMIEKL